ncbi:hypothetical protein HDV00_004314 [Rhizophlyctis rosea]|nr:hypothetical protein HDV00_004314 [Rhizophlyctis rosea]
MNPNPNNPLTLHRTRSVGKPYSPRRPSREWSAQNDQPATISRGTNLGGLAGEGGDYIGSSGGRAGAGGGRGRRSLSRVEQQSGQGQGYGQGGYGRGGGASGEGGYGRGGEEGYNGGGSQGKRNSRKYEGNVVESILFDPNSQPSYSTLLRDFSTLRIRSQHLQSLLIDAQQTITRQNQENSVLRRALAEHTASEQQQHQQHQQHALEKRHSYHQSHNRELQEGAEDDTREGDGDMETEMAHLRSLVGRRDKTISALTATIMSLRAELGAVTLNKAELSSEVKLLRARLASFESKPGSAASGSVAGGDGSLTPPMRPRANTVGEAKFVASASMQPGPWMSLTTSRVKDRWELDSDGEDEDKDTNRSLDRSLGADEAGADVTIGSSIFERVLSPVKKDKTPAEGAGTRIFKSESKEFRMDSGDDKNTSATAWANVGDGAPRSQKQSPTPPSSSYPASAISTPPQQPSPAAMKKHRPSYSAVLTSNLANLPRAPPSPIKQQPTRKASRTMPLPDPYPHSYHSQQQQHRQSAVSPPPSMPLPPNPPTLPQHRPSSMPPSVTSQLASPTTRINQLERERDALEQELLERYRDLRVEKS